MNQSSRIGRNALPPDLKERLRSNTEPVVLRGHAESRPDVPRRWLLTPLVALVVFGGLCAALIPDPPFTQLTSVALFVGAVALGAWLAAYRLMSLRPEAGQRLLLGKSSLALVHRDDVEIIPASSLTTVSGAIHLRGELFDQGGHDPGWMTELGEVIERANKGEEDPWWAAASKGLDIAAPRKKAVALGAGVGLVVALAIELAPGASAVKGNWTKSMTRFDTHVAWMNLREDALLADFRKDFDERMPQVSSLMEAIAFYIDAKVRIGEDFEARALEVLQRFVGVEIAEASDPEILETVLTLKLRAELPKDVVELTARRYRELLEKTLVDNPSIAAAEHALDESDRLDLGYENAKALLERVATLGSELMATGDDDSIILGFAGMCAGYRLEPAFCDPLKERFAEVATTRLSVEISADEFFKLEKLAKKLDRTEEISEALSLRRGVLALAAVRNASDGNTLNEAMSTWHRQVEDETRELVERLAAERASALAKKSATSRDAAKLLPWMFEEEQDAFFETYKDMAAKEANTGSIEDAVAFLAAPDFDLHPDRTSISDRLVTLCNAAYAVPGGIEDKDVAFFSALLSTMCVKGTEELTFKLGLDLGAATGSGTVTNVDDAAPELAAAASEVGDALGRPVKIRHKRATVGALIELSVDGYPGIGMLTYPCTLHVKRLFESTVDKELDVAGTCSRTWY